MGRTGGKSKVVVAVHGLFGRQSKWWMENKVDVDSVAYEMHDLVGCAIENGATFGQLDLPSLASFSTGLVVYHLIEETRGHLHRPIHRPRKGG